MATLSVSYGSDYASYTVSGLTGSYVNTASVDLYLGQSIVDNHFYPASQVAGRTSFSGTFYGLSPRTTYTIWEYVWDSGGNLVSQLSRTFTTTAQMYPIAATVTFDANGGSVSPSSATGSDESTSPEGYVDIYFPIPVRDGYECDYWELRNGSIIYQTHYTPGAYNSIYASTEWPQYTAKAIWRQAGAKAYIYATKNGVTQWWPATPYIHDGSGWVPATPKIYDGGWK